MGWMGRSVNLRGLEGFFSGQLCQREILEEMMLTSPVGLAILRYLCSENLTMLIQYV